MAIEEARREQAMLRLGIQSVSGGGKTLTSLYIAAVLVSAGRRVGVIDSEKKSAPLYLGKPGVPRFVRDTEFEKIEEPTVSDYIRSISAMASAGVEVLIIDSLSHSWFAALDAVDRGGGWTKVGKNVTPLVRKLINKILTYPGHVICTMRSDTKYEISRDEKGKVTMEKIGLAPQVRANTEYEFTVVLDLDRNGRATVIKSRCGDALPVNEEYPREQIPAQMRLVKDWLANGDPVRPIDEALARIKFADDEATLLLAREYMVEQKKAGNLSAEDLAVIQPVYTAKKTELADNEVPV